MTATEIEKPSATLDETTSSNVLTKSDTLEITGFQADEGELSKGYFYSPFFLGSFFATGLSIWAATAAFGYAAPILAFINEDIGPDPRYVWISLVYTVCLAVTLAPVGRLSDIFGRRYWFIGGAVLAVIGSIICATAKSLPVLIGGNVFLGIASAPQLSFHFVLGELIPVKWRYVGNATLYIFTIAGSGLGPAVAYSFVVKHPNVSWRGVYWLLLGVNSLALICWVAFYFPPTFYEKHKRDDANLAWWIKNFDYVGLFLFTAGFIVFILGLSWGGGVYPWKSVAVICSIVLGFATLVIFVLWECYMPLKEPLIPMHLFKDSGYTASIVLLGLGAGIYYAFAIIWPTQVAVLYNNGDSMYVGYVSVLVGMGIISGQIIGGFLTTYAGPQKLQCFISLGIGGVFLACAAVVQPDNKITEIAIIYVGCLFIGWNETICLANSTILVRDQQEIGIAGGVAGSVRSAISAVLTAVYVSILTNGLTSKIASEVPAALVEAGLPASSVVRFLTALTSGSATALAAVPGISQQIITAGTEAYRQANADAYRTVYLSTIAFTGLALVVAIWAPSPNKHWSGRVAATLHHEGQSNAEDVTTEKSVEQV